jgi:hypothetical protein
MSAVSVKDQDEPWQDDTMVRQPDPEHVAADVSIAEPRRLDAANYLAVRSFQVSWSGLGADSLRSARR